jgi:YVTN family beta-propeller protein
MVIAFPTVVLACLLAPQSDEEAAMPLPPAASAGFAVEATLEIGAAPHGIRFSEDGRLAFVAVSGDDEVAVIDCATLEVIRRLPAGKVPLDMVLSAADGTLVTTQFRSTTLIAVPRDGHSVESTDERSWERSWEVGSGPSLFGPRVLDGVAYLSCEFADSLVLYDTRAGEVVQSFPTGKQPYPADVTRDGVLAFVPDRGDSTVTVIDLLNRETAATVPVGEKPEGGALLEDDTTYVAACSGSDELVWINTASYQVVHRTQDVGPRPFSVAATPDGRFLLVNNAGGDTLSIVDVAGRSVVGELTVGVQPIVVRMHPDGRRAFVSNEVSGTVSVITLPRPQKAPGRPVPNEVVVLGAIHGGHLTSERYGLEFLSALIREVDPDVLLTEIPPNRAEEAMRGFLADGEVTEPRVARFPEYVHCVYPLLREVGMEFEIVPTAGWTEPMARFRSSRLAAIKADETRAAEWAAYTTADEASEACLAEHGESDDPRFIHTDAYDDCNDVGLSVYDELFNAELGPGGWTAINQAHYGLIADALDRQSGEGKRFLVIYGAGHKGWFLRELRKRDDIHLLPMAPFLDRAEAALDR